MEINQLRYVLRVAEYMNFSRAAISLSVSQPTLTQQIGKLETELGIMLFDRTTRTVSLTNAGSDFITYATKILNAVEDLENVMQGYRSASRGTVCIGILPDAMLINIAHYISGFTSIHEDILVEVNQSSNSELVNELLDHKIDLAFISPSLINPRTLQMIDYETLIEEEICLAAMSGNSFVHRDAVSIKELTNVEIMLSNEFEEVSAIAQDALSKQVTLNRTLKYSSRLEELVEYILEGRGVSFLPLTIIKQYESEGMVVIHLNHPLKLNISLAISNERKNSEAAMMFHHYVVSQSIPVKENGYEVEE